MHDNILFMHVTSMNIFFNIKERVSADIHQAGKNQPTKSREKFLFGETAQAVHDEEIARFIKDFTTLEDTSFRHNGRQSSVTHQKKCTKLAIKLIRTVQMQWSLRKPNQLG